MPRHIGRQQIVRKRGRHSTPYEYAMTRHRLSAIEPTSSVQFDYELQQPCANDNDRLPLSNRRDYDAPLLAAILATQFDGRRLLVGQDVKRLTDAKLARRADLINFRQEGLFHRRIPLVPHP
jgi:hypothetical protein